MNTILSKASHNGCVYQQKFWNTVCRETGLLLFNNIKMWCLPKHLRIVKHEKPSPLILKTSLNEICETESQKVEQKTIKSERWKRKVVHSSEITIRIFWNLLKFENLIYSNKLIKIISVFSLKQIIILFTAYSQQSRYLGKNDILLLLPDMYKVYNNF